MNPNSPETNFIVKWHYRSCKDLPGVKNHSSIYYKDEIIIFGGHNNDYNINSLYIYNIETDTCKLQPTFGEVPKGRNGHTATLVGGWPGVNQMASDEVYELDLNSFIWQKINDPGIGPVNMHSADLYGDEIIIFRGGNGREYMNDLISFNISNKKSKSLEVLGKIPHPRANHASTLINNTLFIFGGWSGTRRLNDMYSLNLEKLQWSMVELFGLKPSPRAGIRLVNYNQYIMLFGGSGPNSTYLNDLYFYNTGNSILILDNNEWLIPNKIFNIDKIPHERAGHTAVISGRFIYIYGGGKNNNSSLNQMHVLEVDPEPQFKLLKLKSKDNIFNSIKKFYNNPFLSDIKFIIEKHNWTFYGHKFVLSLICEKFRAMFSCDFKENISQEVKLYYNPKIFEVILYYFYTGDIEDGTVSQWTFIDFFEIMKIADEYLLQEVKEWSEGKILKFINVNNFLFVYYYSKKYSADILIEYCNWFHRQNPQSDLDNISEMSITESVKSYESEIYAGK